MHFEKTEKNPKITTENRSKYNKTVEKLPDVTCLETMGTRIQKLRKGRSEKLEYLSKKLGYENASSLSRLESNKSGISIDRLIKLALHFNVSTDYLLGLTNQKEPLYNNTPENHESLITDLIIEVMELLPENSRQAIFKKLRSE